MIAQSTDGVTSHASMVPPWADNSGTSPSPLPSSCILTGQCPHCGSTLVTRTRRDQTRFIGCSGFPACTYRGEYDPMLHQLRDRLTRTEAEAALLRLQSKPTPAADLIPRSLVDRELRRLGEVILRQRYESPVLAAEIMKAIMALRELVRGGRS
jgi:Topoisomerase DNA binding C4 zinc finger